MLDDLLDLALLLEVGERLAGERAVDLQPVDERGNGDQTVRLDVLVELVGSGLVEDNGVLGLVLDCARCQRLLFRALRLLVRVRLPGAACGEIIVFACGERGEGRDGFR